MSDLFSWERFNSAFPKLIESLPVTLGIVIVAVIFGVLLGLVIALIRVHQVPILSPLCRVYVSFMRGTSIFIQMLIIYYGLPILIDSIFHIDINRLEKIIFVYITFSLNTGASLSEVFRSSILAVPSSQSEAAYSVGLSGWQTFIRIILPQATRIAIPSLGAELIALFQNTSLVFLIGIIDVMGRAKTIGSATMHSLEPYLGATLIYVVISLIIKAIFTLIDRKLTFGR